MRALIVSVLLLVTACAHHESDRQPLDLPRHDIAEQTDIRFSPDDWPQALYADLYRPKAEGAHPVVLVVHGGGWERRSRDDMTATSRTLAARGFVVMNVDYRFAPAHQFPAQLHDLQLAMHWLRDNAGDFSGDASRISALGFSSGAHLVSLLAVVAGQQGELDQPYGGTATRPLAVVAGGTPTDLRKYPGGKLVPQFLGGGREQVPEVFANASPVTHIHPQVPPFFFFHGGRDRLVPLDHATDMLDQLHSVGVDAELYLMRGRGHISSFVTSRQALEHASEFLRHHSRRAGLQPHQVDALQ